MSDQSDFRRATAKVLDQDEVEGVLTARFYQQASATKSTLEPPKDAKPAHYKVICISLYTEDLKRLDAMVDSLKARGLTKANRSALIRYALGAVDLDAVPRGL